jgi:serine/threonine protein kinase
MDAVGYNRVRMPESAFTEGGLIAGRYRLDALLGEGGMGEVWAATHTVTRRAVALKFLKDGLRNKVGLRQRFMREASTASALKHPNVVEILDVFDLEDRTPVLVMELLHGETLGMKLGRDARLSVEETAALLLPVCSAVGTGHALGIVHRDIKPDNIFLARTADETKVKVLDFGIAKLTAEHYLEGGRSALITDTGSMLGTPCYMAPEQATGEGADHRSDIWSIGVILYECLSGTRPIEGENLAQVVSRLVSAGIIPLERLAPELPHDVSALVMQMLSRDRARRPQNLGEVGKVLGHYTVARSPAFGPPSLGGPPIDEPESSKSRVKIATSRSVDPQGATMLSSPQVGSSVTVSQPKPVPGWRRAAPVALLLALVAVVAVVLSNRGSRTTENASSAVPPSPPAVQNPEPSREVVAPAETAPENTDSAPTPAPSAAPSVTSKKAPTTTRVLTKAPTTKKTPVRQTPAPVANPQKDEGTLFPGRK